MKRTHHKSTRKKHLALALPVCPLRGTACTYHAHCATGITLPLAISTQSVDRSAYGTDVCLSAIPVVCEVNNWFDSRSDMGAI